MATTSFTKKSLGLETVEPALTPTPTATTRDDQTLPKKPKLGAGKSKKRDIPEGLWTKCPKCETMVFDKELDENLKVCPKCEHHFPIGSRERIHSLVETCTFEEMDAQHDQRGRAQFHRAWPPTRPNSNRIKKRPALEGRGRHRHLQNRRSTAPRSA